LIVAAFGFGVGAMTGLGIGICLFVITVLFMLTVGWFIGATIGYTFGLFFGLSLFALISFSLSLVSFLLGFFLPYFLPYTVTHHMIGFSDQLCRSGKNALSQAWSKLKQFLAKLKTMIPSWTRVQEGGLTGLLLLPFIQLRKILP